MTALTLPGLASAEKALPVWELGAGIAALDLADYRGSAHHHRYIAPLPYGIYRGERLRVDRNQSRFRILEGSYYSVDWSVMASPPADSDENPVREGMPDLAPAIEWGPQLKWMLNEHWNLRARLHLISTYEREDGLKERGLVFSPAIHWDTRLPHHFRLGASLSAQVGTQRNHDYYYSVAPEYATFERPVYEAESGFAGWNTTLTLSRRTNDNWYGIFIRHHWLDNSVVDDSPLVDDTSSWGAGFALTWVFLRSQNTVSAP